MYNELYELLDSLVADGKRDQANTIYKAFMDRYREGFQDGYFLGYEDSSNGEEYQDTEDKWDLSIEPYYTSEELRKAVF